MTIKKAYQDIVTLLQDNEGSKVSSILPQVIEMASAKTGGGGGGRATTFHKDEEGVVRAIKCYYHNLWMDPQVVEFGQKTGSATGYNSMCKDGNSKWSKQQREAKKAKNDLLQALADGEIEASDLPNQLAIIEDDTNAINPRADGYGFDTLEECLESEITAEDLAE